MPQDKETGAAANKWGNETARALAKILGANPTGNPGNEFNFNGDVITIRCAKKKTTKVGVTRPMLGRVKYVFGAFEQSDGSFDLWSLTAELFHKQMHLSRSKSNSAGKVNMVSRGFFYSNGARVTNLELSKGKDTAAQPAIAAKAQQASRIQSDPVFEILREVKVLAKRFRQQTGKPLGVAGEVAEHEAARLLDLTLMKARHAAYDATEVRNGKTLRVQIKARCILNDNPGQRMGKIDVKKDCDTVLLVLMDEALDAYEIYEAPYSKVVLALTTPGSKARNEKGALSVSKFKSIGTLRWNRSN